MTASPPEVRVRDARPEDAEELQRLLAPFVAARQLLDRDVEEVRRLTMHGFAAECDGQIVGFAAVEIYSPKLAEVQCLAVSDRFQGQGIGRQLIEHCVARARRENVLELMAITASDEFLRSCGFDYSLPDQKRALFVHTRDD